MKLSVKTRGPSLWHINRFSVACGGTAESAKDQTQDLTIRGTELEKKLVCYTKIEALVGKG